MFAYRSNASLQTNLCHHTVEGRITPAELGLPAPRDYVRVSPASHPLRDVWPLIALAVVALAALAPWIMRKFEGRSTRT